MNRGILYIATGQEFVAEAIVSARTVADHMPDVPIALITDLEREPSVFDTVIRTDDTERTFCDQISNLARSPFDRTICLDTDVYVDATVNDVFDLLDGFDVAAAHNHDRSRYEVDGVPPAFPEYNTGVVAYRNDEQFEQFLSEWAAHHAELSTDEIPHNQPSFRKALYHSDLRVATLPPEYNLMVRYPGHAVGTVRLFHGRLLDIDSPGAGMYYDIPTAATKINSTSNHRVFTQLGGLTVHSNKEDNPLHRVRMILQRNGVSGTVSKAISRITS